MTRGAGVSLERIRELLKGDDAPIPPRSRAIGSIEVRSHLLVADGVEILIEPSRAGLSPEQVRGFVKGVMAVYAQVSGEQIELEQQKEPRGQDHG